MEMIHSTRFPKFLLTPLVLLFSLAVNSQKLDSLFFEPSGDGTIHIIRTIDNREWNLHELGPFFSFKLNDVWHSPAEGHLVSSGGSTTSELPQKITIEWTRDSSVLNAFAYMVTFRNVGMDTVKISNVLPFNHRNNHLFITADGPPDLARARLFRPGYGAVGVTLPDNAWDLGYTSIQLDSRTGLSVLARRYAYEKGIVRRYSVSLPPAASVSYRFYFDLFEGPWQNGLKQVFHGKYLYDLTNFDETLYKREDLAWIRSRYILTIQFAWDHRFYDLREKKYNFFQFLEDGKKIFGGYDVFALWPTWPRLGLDERNQFDLYSNLPFGLPKLKELSNYARFNNTRFFISYNPWDNSTRPMNQLKGMSSLIKAVDADGVVLDTRGNSSWELQAAADSVRDGVIMYSEGMAVPKDMPGIIAGRVHDAIFMQPPLNLNKVIRPDFAIFRVCQMGEGRIHRELAISFFNGYGTEINTMAPGKVEGMDEDLQYLGKTTRILRENSSVFLNDSLVPMIPALADSIWVNEWTDGNKKLYTILSLASHGFNGPLFPVIPVTGTHFVSLWNHTELEPVKSNDAWYLPTSINPFLSSLTGTRLEGENQCIARFRNIIRASISGDSLNIAVQEGNRLCIWNTFPSYAGRCLEYPAMPVSISISGKFKDYSGPLIIQLFNGRELLDERVITVPQQKIICLTRPEKTEEALLAPAGMLEIPTGTFVYKTFQDESFIPYPPQADSVIVTMPRYFMDQYPVTNEQYLQFLQATGYVPSDTINYLKHWINGMYARGQSGLPVVWVSLEDARAYARWAGKRLPTELEWQYAAQGTDGRIWPWGNDYHATKCNNSFGLPTPVDAFPKGRSPFKVEDMVGNVWQYTADEYDDGNYYFTIIRGGSYFNPTSSEWYIKGGPQPVNKRQILIRVSEGFDRSSTIGFRCVKDAR